MEIGYYSSVPKPIQYPVVIVEYHARWYGRVLLRVADWLRDAAYWRAVRVEATIPDPADPSSIWTWP